MEESGFYGRDLGEGGGDVVGYEVGAAGEGGEGEVVLGVGCCHFWGRGRGWIGGSYSRGS